MAEVISQETIEGFLNGWDPEEFIVGVEYDYRTNKIYKVIQDPERGKIVKPDTFTPFLWVGDLVGLGFYNNSKTEQKKAMTKHGILIEKLESLKEDNKIEFELLDKWTLKIQDLDLHPGFASNWQEILIAIEEVLARN